jgi:ABC-type transporter Mla MlaB component
METKVDFNSEVDAFHNLVSKVQGSNFIFDLQSRPGIVILEKDELELPGAFFQVFCSEVRYYDLRNILFINNTGVANLIKLLKVILEKGYELQLINVNKKIKEKIMKMGLGNIIYCK